jgi:heptosyltransferase-2
MKILVIQQKMIGDVLISSLLCDNLRKAYPKAQIDYMVYESTIAVLQGNTSFNNLILFEKKHQNSKRAYFKLLVSVRRQEYDVIIDAYSKLESWIIVLFSNAKQKISYWKKGRTFLYTDNLKRKKIADTNLGLIIEQRLELLNPLKLKIDLDTFPKIFVTSEERDFAKNMFASHKIEDSKKTIMLSILGSSPEKTYPAAYMTQLIDFIADTGEMNLLFNYMPNQIEEAKLIYKGCKKETKAKINFLLIGKSVRDFIAIMDACDLIIGNDGGAINMAKALRKPSFIIFCPWIDKNGWATFEDGVSNVSVHLNDFKPELFFEKSASDAKKNNDELYHLFIPELIMPKLKVFLEIHLDAFDAMAQKEIN